MSLLIPAPPELQRLGISAVPSDLYSIGDRLSEYDPLLQLAWIPEMERFAILRHRPDGSRFDIIRVCAEDDGSFRIPDGRDLQHIREGDMWRNNELSYGNYDLAREKRQAKQEQDFAEFTADLSKEAVRALHHDKVVHEPKVSMHLSDRELKKPKAKD